MQRVSLREIQSNIDALALIGNSEMEVDSVSTDTRTLQPGELFVAIKGDNFDGHDYVGKAFEAGAKAVITEKPFSPPKGVAMLLARDTKLALQDLALMNRRRCGVPVIAVTGSTGKTSTKDLIFSVLAQNFRVLATKENFNNEIGVPLTLLKLDSGHDVAVVELGMRGAGQIGTLARICEPQIAVISNVGTSHIEFLGSKKNIAKAKGELLDYVPPDGWAYLNGDSPLLNQEASRCAGRVIFFGTNPKAEILLTEYQNSENGVIMTVQIKDEAYCFHTNLTGRHMAYNALPAIGIGFQLGLSAEEVAAGLSSTKISSQRLDVIEYKQQTIINDAYNASPESMEAALKVLVEKAGNRPKVAILGGMLELGELTASAHHSVGKLCRQMQLQYLLTFGDEARKIAVGAREAGFPPGRIYECNSVAEVLAVVKRVLSPDAVLLVKGSRALRMEDIVLKLTAQ